MTVESAEKHSPVELSRAPDNTVNEIFVYTDETRHEDAERRVTWSYTLHIIRIGGRAMTQAEIDAAVAEVLHD